MNFKIAVVSTLLAASAVFSAAYAETAVNTEYKRAENTITITGTTDAEGYARLLVLNPETDTALADDAAIWTQTVYADEALIADGKFTFETFSLVEGSKTGAYILRVACGSGVSDTTLEYATVETATDLLLNTDNAETLSEYIEKYNDVYMLSTGEGSSFASFSDEGKLWVLGNLISSQPTDIDGARKIFNVSTDFWRISAEPWAVVGTIIENNSSALGISLTAYNTLTSGEKDSVSNSLSGNLYTSSQSFKTAFDEAVSTVINNRNSGTGGGISGGSGGSRGSGSSISISAGSLPGKTESVTSVQPTPEITDEENDTVFADITEHWAENDIMLLYGKGIVNGKTETEFKPDAYVTRAEAVKMIILAFAEVKSEAVCDFDDVGEASWMYPYIATACSDNIIAGYGNGKAGADDNITRQDTAVMLMRAAKAYGKALPAGSITPNFKDAADISDYAREAVETLCTSGIISGYEDNTFGAQNGTTRAQLAKMLAGFLK